LNEESGTRWRAGQLFDGTFFLFHNKRDSSDAHSIHRQVVENNIISAVNEARLLVSRDELLLTEVHGYWRVYTRSAKLMQMEEILVK
jgi:hypothetical protein